MQYVTDTVRALVDSLAPVQLSINRYGETAIDTQVMSCTYSARCATGDHFSIGSACSGSVRLMLDTDEPLEWKGALVQVQWRVATVWYPLFTGYVTREQVDNGALKLELNDAIYVYGGITAIPSGTENTAADCLRTLAKQMSLAVEDGTITQSDLLPLTMDNLPTNASCATALALVAGCLGGNAVITRWGELAVVPYSFADLEATPYEGNDVADATQYTATGLAFIRSDTDESGGVTESTFLAGDGSLRLENDLASQTAADYAFARISGLTVCGGTFTIPGGLLLEPGDIITVVTGGGRSVACMELTMEIDGGVKTSITSYGGETLGGVTGSLNQRVNNALNAADTAMRQVVAERAAREKALEELDGKLSTASGLYATVETLEDGSAIYYLHDQATLSESVTVIKFTAEAIGVSNNGGERYDYGFTTNGTAILELIYAVGLDATHITAGILQSADNGETFYLDLSQGIFRMSGSGKFMAPDGNSYITMSGDEFVLYARAGTNGAFVDICRIGYTSDSEGEDYPYVLMGSYDAEGEDFDKAALIKKFANGLWMGNSAPRSSTGTFLGLPGAGGFFVDTLNATAYAVSGTEMQEVYLGTVDATFA